MFGRREEIDLDKIDTIVGKGCTFSGTLTATGSVRIDGSFEGTIENKGDVVIGEGAKCTAKIKARNVVVAGEVQGDIEASGKAELVPTGKVYGDIASSSLVIADGAVFQGASKMRSDKDPKKPPTE